jgi:Na+-driven multidrug efflux pump
MMTSEKRDAPRAAAARRPGGSPLATVLSLLAVLVGFYGVASASLATSGVAAVGLACLVAIFARMAQAATQHAELARWLHRHDEKAE